jgi:hypothetical protein
MALDHRELVDRDRDRVGASDLRHSQHSPDLHLAVLGDVERFESVVEQGQILSGGGGRHPGDLLGSVLRPRAEARSAEQIVEAGIY